MSNADKGALILMALTWLVGLAMGRGFQKWMHGYGKRGHTACAECRRCGDCFQVRPLPPKEVNDAPTE